MFRGLLTSILLLSFSLANELGVMGDWTISLLDDTVMMNSKAWSNELNDYGGLILYCTPDSRGIIFLVSGLATDILVPNTPQVVTYSLANQTPVSLIGEVQERGQAIFLHEGMTDLLASLGDLEFELGSLASQHLVFSVYDKTGTELVYPVPVDGFIGAFMYMMQICEEL